MGKVYLARQRYSRSQVADGQYVALKLLRPEAPAHARRLFYHEGAVLPRLQHAHIVQYIERGRGIMPEVGQFDYLAVSYIAGETIEDLLCRRNGPLPAAIVLGIVAQVAEALRYLHRRGIAHCDLKLSNVMLERAAPHAVLIDFSTARAPDFVGQPIAVGTLQYMAPEQLDPRNHCDGRTDLYALGIMIYEMLTGRRLFPRRTTDDLKQGQKVTPSATDLAALPGNAVADVVMRCLLPDPSDRYAAADVLFNDLRSALGPMLTNPPSAPVAN
jgi:serine/threonine protein kinase